MKRAVIFDLDGTLWETLDCNYECMNEVSKKYNLGEIDRDIICKNYGNSKEQSAKLFFPNLPLEEAFKILDESDALNIKKLTESGAYIYPGLEETLFNLKQKYSLYIVSNTATKKYIEAFLISTKLFKYFDDYYAASEIHLEKGKTIIKLIDDYYIDEAIYVGDTKIDFEASIRAKIPFIQCLYGFGEELDCKYKINDIRELPNKVDSIFEN